VRITRKKDLLVVDKKKINSWRSLFTMAELDEQTVQVLSSTDKFFVQQQIRWGEAITQGCFEQKNRYHVFNKDTNEMIFVIKEESADLNRCCCAPVHSLFAEFYLADGNGESGGSPVMTLEREGCDCGSPCPKPCLCCFACNESCSDGAQLYAGDLSSGPAAGETNGQRSKNALLGQTIQPLNGGKFKPVLQIMERDAYKGDEPVTFAATRGPCVFGGCSELCCSSEFGVSRANPGMSVDDIHKLDFDYMSITKVKPGGFTQAMREAFTDSDLYEIEFKTPDVTPQQKANVLGSMVLLDYMFFERDNDMIGYDDGIKINCFNCFCYGCICSCTLHFKNNDS